MKQIIYGTPPSKSNSYTPVGNRMFKKQNVKDYEKTFILQYRLHHKRIEGYFKLTMTVYFPSESHDLDGSLKVILDCLQKLGAVKNDKNNKELHIYKEIDEANPRIEFELDAL